MARAADVEAGRAYVSFYLDRVGYDRQVDQLSRDHERRERKAASQPSMFSMTESWHPETSRPSEPNNIDFLEEGWADPPRAKPGQRGGVGELKGGFKELVEDIGPLVSPMAAGVAKATTLMAAGVGKAAASTKTATTSMAVDMGKATASSKAFAVATSLSGRAVSRSIAKIPGRIASIPGRIAKIPGQLAGAVSSAIQGVSSAVRSIGMDIAKVGGLAAGAAALISTPIVMATKSWAAYGDKIRQVQNDLLRFQLTAEEASVISRVAEQTGESMEKLAEQMRGGTRDFSRWRNELAQSGMLMSGAGLGAALALSRAYYSLRASVAGLKNAIGAALGPTLKESAEVLTGIIRGITKWIAANKPLVVQIFKIASAIGIAATAITTLGGAIAGAGTVLSPFTAALAAIAGGLAIVEVRTGAGQSIWAAYGDSVRRVWDTVSAYLGQMLSLTNEVMGGIKDALMAGDLALAVEVMWAGAKVAWMSALMEIDTLTSGMFNGILRDMAAGNWTAVWIEIWTGIQNEFDTIIGAIQKAWVGMIETLKSALYEFFFWANVHVFNPMLDGVNQIVMATGWGGTDFGGPVIDKTGEVKDFLTDKRMALGDSLKSDEEIAAEKQAIDDKTAEKKEKREEEKADKLAELEKQKGKSPELDEQRAASQQELDDAKAAAAAAREAADRGRLQERDFAVSMETKSIARFSGEALGLSVGRSDDPAKRTAKLNEEQLRELKIIAKDLGLTFRELIRLNAQGGFAQ